MRRGEIAERELAAQGLEGDTSVRGRRTCVISDPRMLFPRSGMAAAARIAAVARKPRSGRADQASQRDRSGASTSLLRDHGMRPQLMECAKWPILIFIIERGR